MSDKDRFAVLSDYTAGVITRSCAMGLLGADWYGDLRQEVAAAGLSIKLPEEVLETMRQSADEVFAVLSRGPQKKIE